jgi:hypothetical protein
LAKADHPRASARGILAKASRKRQALNEYKDYVSLNIQGWKIWFRIRAMQKDESRPPDSEKNSIAQDEPIYSKDGVDLTIIRWMLSMTPTERLQTLQQNVRSIMRLRGDKPHS